MLETVRSFDRLKVSRNGKTRTYWIIACAVHPSGRTRVALNTQQTGRGYGGTVWLDEVAPHVVAHIPFGGK
jgi:hypothetical protein